MTIILGILIELITVISSCLIKLNSHFDKLLSLSKKGYKIDYDTYEQYLHNAALKEDKNKILNTILLLIPGINLLNSLISEYQVINEKDPLIEENKIPMSEKEIKEYNSLKNRYQRQFYNLFMYIEDTNEKDLIFEGLQPVIIDNYLLKLNEKILPLSYSLDEVLKLNNLTNYSYRIGTVDNINTAIIGIPNSTYKLARVQYNYDDDFTTHDFKEMTLEDAKDKKFIVYLFDPSEELKNKVDEGIKEIQITRQEKEHKPIISNFYPTNNYELKRIRKR